MFLAMRWSRFKKEGIKDILLIEMTWPNIFNYAFRDRAQSRYMYEMSFRSC
jgi:hypothetical protein